MAGTGATVWALVHAMTNAARRAYLRERGWWRLGGAWRAPEPENRDFYTLAAATFAAVAREHPELPATKRRPVSGIRIW